MGTKAGGQLLIIGGAEDRDGECEVLSKFVELAGGSRAVIVVITTATKRGLETGNVYTKVLSRVGASEVVAVSIQNRTDAASLRNVKLISKATGIFFTGGDQLRITSILGGTAVDRLLHQRLNQGVIIAGTSAGASAMSDTMIVEGDDDKAPKKCTLKMAPGLGFVEEVVIDQHFAQRGRIGRLLTAVAQNPYILGIGIDEDTAVLVSPDDRLQVIGSQTVTIIDGLNLSLSNVSELSPYEPLALTDVLIHILPHPYGFDLAARRPITCEQV